jgi:lantibiotic modifying enzyme
MSQQAFLESADRIGHRLCRDALWAGRRCNWLGWSLAPVHQQYVASYRALDVALYDGTAGVALFLGWLVAFTRDPLQKATLLGAVRRLREALADPDPAYRFGYHSGLAGISEALRQVATTLEDEELARESFDLLGDLARAAPDDGRLDLLTGSAGLIPVLLGAALRSGRGELFDAAVAHGQLLLRTSVRSERGWSWPTAGPGGPHYLVGYAHGAGGIACALLELYRATGEPSYRDAALEGLRYERGHYSPEHRNWPDLRAAAPAPGAPAAGPTYPAAWCHGAPGVGCSRLHLRHLGADDAEAAAELDAALQTTAAALAALTTPGQGNYCLCHGAVGCADLLLLAARSLGRPELARLAEEVGKDGMSRYHHPDGSWPCGAVNGRETPGLMVGLAGIGHFYLRLHAPDLVPSVLLVVRRDAGAPAGMGGHDAGRPQEARAPG